MNPVLYLAGVGLLLGALSVSLIAIATTVDRSLPKIIAALRGQGGL
jgi:Flp pilus assembly pilin Flp